jgi:hypothetical protein
MYNALEGTLLVSYTSGQLVDDLMAGDMGPLLHHTTRSAPAPRQRMIAIRSLAYRKLPLAAIRSNLTTMQHPLQPSTRRVLYLRFYSL